MFVLVYSVCSVIYLICMFHNKKESKYPNIICFLFLFFYVEMSCLLFSGCPHFRSLANAIWLFAPCDCCRVSISMDFSPFTFTFTLVVIIFVFSEVSIVVCFHFLAKLSLLPAQRRGFGFIASTF